jgi:CheY-like chemotaxis protein
MFDMETNNFDPMGKLIFFADDDKMILNLLEYTFSSRNDYEVKTFKSGEELLKALDQKPDLIVLDHFFTKSGENLMTGLDTLKKIRENNYNLPIIMLSNQPDDKLVPEFEKHNAKYIPKDSFFIDSLIESINQAVME